MSGVGRDHEQTVLLAQHERTECGSGWKDQKRDDKHNVFTCVVYEYRWGAGGGRGVGHYYLLPSSILEPFRAPAHSCIFHQLFFARHHTVV